MENIESHYTDNFLGFPMRKKPTIEELLTVLDTGPLNLDTLIDERQDDYPGINLAWWLAFNHEYVHLEQQIYGISTSINLNSVLKNPHNSWHNAGILYLLIKDNQWTLIEKLVARSEFIHFAEFLDNVIHERRHLLNIIFEHNYNYLHKTI